MSLHGKDLICTQDWSIEELQIILNTADNMKKNRFDTRWSELFKNRNFLMMFYSPSVRTHLSFTAAATELGGHAQYLAPDLMSRLQSRISVGESIEDAAKVMSLYMSGIGIRIMESALTYYGEGHAMIREYARHASVPVINLADDTCHPCQSLADLMGWAEWFSRGTEQTDFTQLQGKKLLLTWGRGAFARSWNSPQGSLLLASRFGMDITLARPEGYDMDPLIYDKIRMNCAQNGREFKIVADPESGYSAAHVVYSRNWLSQKAYEQQRLNKDEEISQALRQSAWICTEKKMRKTDNGIFTHPMPVDRGNEVEDSVANGPRSVVYNVAANRLHVQKSIIAHIMGNSID